MKVFDARIINDKGKKILVLDLDDVEIRYSHFPRNILESGDNVEGLLDITREFIIKAMIKNWKGIVPPRINFRLGWPHNFSKFYSELKNSEGFEIVSDPRASEYQRNPENGEVELVNGLVRIVDNGKNYFLKLDYKESYFGGEVVLNARGDITTLNNLITTLSGINEVSQEIDFSHKPKDIEDRINSLVVGQEIPIRKIATNVCAHYRMIDDPDYKKPNMIVVGETGVGKTLTFNALASYLGVPYYKADASSITGIGIVGRSVEDILVGAYRASGNDLEAAQKGMIYIDEIGKKVKKETSGRRDVKGEDVLGELLTVMEGAIVPINIGSQAQPENIEIDTSKILFIVGGRVDGLQDKVTERYEEQKEDWYNHVDSEVLIRSGFIPEFVGRIPKIVGFQNLQEEDFRKILTLPTSSLQTEKRLIEANGVRLIYTPDDIVLIAKKAFETEGNLGGRGLDNYVSNLIEPLSYQAQNGDLHGDVKLVEYIPR